MRSLTHLKLSLVLAIGVHSGCAGRGGAPEPDPVPVLRVEPVPAETAGSEVGTAPLSAEAERQMELRAVPQEALDPALLRHAEELASRDRSTIDGATPTRPASPTSEVLYVVEPIHFSAASARLDLAATQTLDLLAERLLVGDLAFALVVQGYSDGETDRPPDEAHLGVARASAISRYLLERHGIARERMRATGLDPEYPKSGNASTGRVLVIAGRV